MIEQNSIIKLGGKYDYVVIFSTVYENENYVFLTNVDLPADSAFYKVSNDSHLEIVKDGEIIKKLLEIFNEQNK